jgi:hypothetical protein
MTKDSVNSYEEVDSTDAHAVEAYEMTQADKTYWTTRRRQHVRLTEAELRSLDMPDIPYGEWRRK